MDEDDLPDCPECDGDGFIDCECPLCQDEHSHICKTCDGSGKEDLDR